MQPLIEAYLGPNQTDHFSFMPLAKRVRFAGLSRHLDTLSIRGVISAYVEIRRKGITGTRRSRSSAGPTGGGSASEAAAAVSSALHSKCEGLGGLYWHLNTRDRGGHVS